MNTKKILIKTEYEVRGNYGQGFEMVYASDDVADILQRLKEYRDNEPQYTHRACILRTYRQMRTLKSGETKHKDVTIASVLRKGRDYTVNYLPIQK